MVIKSSELIYKDHPLTMDGIKRFADSIEIGDVVPTMRKIRVWTSNSNFTFHEKFEKVTVVKKYPYLVEFRVNELDRYGRSVTEILTWNEFVIGYCKCSGVVSMDDKESLGNSNKKTA